MSGSYPNLLAGGINNEGTFAPFELWAGESDTVTSQGTAGANLAQFLVVMRDTTTKNIVPWVEGQQAIGFMAQPAVQGGPAAYFTGGVPNHAALVWPAGVTTLAARKAAFDGTNITVSALL